jgi:hypothetical protein
LPTDDQEDGPVRHIQTARRRTALRRAVPLAIALALGLGATACGSGGSDSSKKSGSSTPSTAAPSSGGAGF